MTPRPPRKCNTKTEMKSMQRLLRECGNVRGKSGRMSSGHDLMTPTTTPAITPMAVRKIRSDHADLLAHVISASLIICTSCWRSASGLVGSKSAGASSGERRMIAPSSQKGGNTVKDFFRKSRMNARYYYSQNPNLKRYMASVTGSTGVELYAGNSVASAYGGGASAFMAMETRLGATYESWRLS